MPRIPRNEQTVGFGAQQMPFSSGDGYQAPGRATEQLGRSIQGLAGPLASLGGALAAQQEKTDGYKDDLTTLEFKNEWDLDNIKAQQDYQGDGTGFAAERAQRYQDLQQKYLPRLSPQGQQRFSLRAEAWRGASNESNLRFEYGRKDEAMLATASSSIDKEAEKLAYKYPREIWSRDDAEGIYVRPDADEIAGNLMQIMQGQDAISNAYPGSFARSVALKKQALDSVAKFLSGLPPDVQKKVVDRLSIEAAREPVRPPVGPTSTIRGQIRDFTSQPGRGYGRMERPTHIVLHDVSGNDPERKRVPAGGNIPNYHITFDRSGINMEVPLDRKAPHAVAYNHNSIGIAHIGYEGDKLDDAALKNGALAVLMVQERTGIKAENILTHPEGGSAATRRGSKDPREASWKGDVLAYIEKNRPALVAELKSGVGGPDRVTETPRSGALKPSLTAYAPKRGASNVSGAGGEGGYEAARPGPDGQAIVRTLDDVAAGRSSYVTIAGDASQIGKTYTIPKISYTDADGKTRELTNVKAVVHDTGSAFNGKGDSRFDVPIARDVSDKVMAANHAAWKKAGVEFVPEGAEPQPAPVAQRGLTRFAGLPTANDAGRPSANENAPTGQRAPNTIPAAPGQSKAQPAPQQVAQAPAGNPASGRSVLSYVGEYIRERKGAYDQAYMRAVSGMVDEVEKLAQDGIVHARLPQIAAEVDGIGDPQMKQRIAIAVATQGEVKGLEALPVLQAYDYVAMKRASYGGVMTPEQQANLKLLDGAVSAKAKALDDDHLGYGQKVGLLPVVPQLTRETFTPQLLQQRLQMAAVSAQQFEVPLSLIRPHERAWMTEVVKAGGQPLMGMLGVMAKGLGPALPMAVSEIAKDHPEAVAAGWLVSQGVNLDTAKAITDGIARRNDPNYKAASAPQQKTLQETDAQAVLGDVFDGYPQTQKDSIMRAAELIYEARNRKPAEYNAELFKTALGEVLGRNERNGQAFGGVYSQSPSLFGGMSPLSWREGSGGSRNIVLPPHIRSNAAAIEDIKFAISQMTPAEMAEAGITPPTFRDGRPMPMVKALSGVLLQADSDGQVGRYVISHGKPGAEQYVLTTPRPYEPKQTEAGRQQGKADYEAPPWASEAAAPLAPQQQLVLDLRQDSALSRVLRRKLGPAVIR